MHKEFMEILLEGNPFLYKTLSSFDFSTNQVDLDKLCSTMYDTMIENNGMGLAANQVGIEQRVFIMDNEERYYFNPKIVSESNELCIDKEGCLSFPNLFLYVNRPDKIDVNFLDIEGKNVTMLLEDLEARIFLHEFDHLEGITFDTRVSKFKLQIARERQRKLENK